VARSDLGAEYWTHQLFYVNEIETFWPDERAQKLNMAIYWLTWTGQSKVYQFTQLNGDSLRYRGRNAREMFWASLLQMRKEIRGDFRQTGSEAGRRKYLGIFETDTLDDEWYED
jgi:hypothetical protein